MARQWVAVLELGPRAALAGVSALQYDVVATLTDEAIHVFVPKGATRRRLPGVVPHESRRWGSEDLVTVGLRRTEPAVTAVSAALWSVTPRQASYVLILAVQQGLCRPNELAEVMGPVRRHRFRRELQTVVLELADGVRSVGEHELPWVVLADTVRELTLLSEGRHVLRIPLTAWRLDSARVLDALEAVFRARGWSPAALAS